LASSVIVPAPVWIPQPNGAKTFNWSSSLSRSVTLTTEHSLTLVSREKLDCPKKEPPISSPGVSKLENAPLVPLKLICPQFWQNPGAPNWQLWHSLQNENDRRTLSPSWTLVTLDPVDLTKPEPARQMVSLKIAHDFHE
jgi:hypothetical protein